MKELFPNRSGFNKALITLFVAIDAAAVLLVFFILHDSQSELIKEVVGGNWTWLIGPVGMLGLLLVLIDGLALHHSFPVSPKKIALLFIEKIIAIVIVSFQGSSLITSIYIYSLAEVIALSGGFGLVLILYRFKIPLAMYMKEKTEPTNLKQDIKQYFKGAEIYPTILFAVPMVLWAIGLTYIGFVYVATQSSLPSIVVVISWIIVLVSLLEQRFRLLYTYFRNWFIDYKKKLQN